MSRASKVERARRIEELVDLLVAGVPRRGILAWAAQQGERWQLSERQIDAYLAGARDKLAAAATPDHSYERGRTAARLQMLFSKALAAGNLVVALQVLRSLAQLLGLDAPAEVSYTGEIDLSAARDELAAQLAELLESGRFEQGGPDET